MSDALAARRRRERLSERFRPDPVQWLFIGESPPASGRFFYQADSGLYRAMRDAFQLADPSIADANFLAAFQASGCYLIDLCLDPVDALHPTSRREACRKSGPSLSRTIADLAPKVIVTVVRSIEEHVLAAAHRIAWSGSFIHLPYPGRWSRHRAIFVAALASELRHHSTK